MTTYYNQTTPTDDFDFDLSNVSTQSNFDCIPPGEYQMQAVAIEITYSKAGNRMVKAQFQILGGEHDNRRIFEIFTLENSNPQTVEIALRQIKQWIMACGFSGNEKLNMALLKSLEGKEFIGKIYIQADKTGQYSDKNRIRLFMPLPGSAPSTKLPARQPEVAKPQQTQQPPPSTAPQRSARPWEAKR